LPRALRLRGLGGQIAIDFAPMSKAHRKQIEQSLRAAFKADGIETSLVGWTTMGLFEAQRKRERLAITPLLDSVL
jgi:Ribonuclease G/E